MKTKPTNGDRVRLANNRGLRAPVPVGAIGVCTGDVWMFPDLVWVRFDGCDDQQVRWSDELDDV